MIGWLVAFISFAIGLFNFCLLKGWLVVHPLDLEYSEAWIQKHRFTTLITALITTGAGVMCVLHATGTVQFFAAKA
ncbi:hypothetical protein [Prosthecobacter vanneervenii]|uniref:Uncharacterized protein n=1 Tax=Prosthecobacter vanneervenii TaxID=48466 RepID=A0A7W7Y793_9BACT|nr:hypothetical protein [Prosthecobacter vanneervenii]MBB5030717.1 hypothetical protein [Prosthecobacter vanneervenii]